MEKQDTNNSSQNFDRLMGIRESSSNEIRSSFSSSLDHSGNSNNDIQINIEVDTAPLAFSLLSLAYANKQLTREEFDLAVQELKIFSEDRRNRMFNGGKRNRIF
ncbi:hypothetical protein [Metabacillus fastidiosus]|uniref:Uncharacterized protein n=1 Tax=Metabacillus fastidiosus TaxID=1458 RepID=A0ABU6P3S7_9BACI|nr:hypothetical protein [Metabacillus fastidiosus]MED4456119.1 hypothetical protein [Metabacillus fastidiosus]